jgi:hypothetical protein
LPALSEILKYHVVNRTVVDASVANSTVAKLKVGTTAVLGPFKTELAGVKGQKFCKLDAKGLVSVELYKLANTTNITVIASGMEVEVIAPVHTCGGILYILDGVLLPCSLADSNLDEIVAYLQSAAASTSPPPTTTRSGNTTTNTTNTTSGGTSRDVDLTKKGGAAASAAGQLLVAAAASAVMLLVGAVA